MLNLLFNTLLTITPHNTPKRRRKEGWSPIQFVTPTDRALLECRYHTQFREGYCEIRISSSYCLVGPKDMSDDDDDDDDDDDVIDLICGSTLMEQELRNTKMDHCITQQNIHLAIM